MSDDLKKQLTHLFQSLDMPADENIESLARRVAERWKEVNISQEPFSVQNAELPNGLVPRLRWTCLFGIMTGILFMVAVVAILVLVPEPPIIAFQMGGETPVPSKTVTVIVPTNMPTTAPPTNTPIPTAIPTDTPQPSPEPSDTSSPVPPTETPTSAPCVPIEGLDFIYSPELPRLGETLRVTASVTSGDSSIRYTWDFVDGVIASGEIVTHAYVFSGTYALKLVADNSCGSEEVVKQVRVNPWSAVKVVFKEAKVFPEASYQGALTTLKKDDLVAWTDKQEESDDYRFLSVLWNDSEAWLNSENKKGDGTLLAELIENDPSCQPLGFAGVIDQPEDRTLAGETFIYDSCQLIVGYVQQDTSVKLLALSVDGNWAWIRIWDRDRFVLAERLTPQ